MEIKATAKAVVVGLIVLLMIDPAEVFATFVAGATVAGVVIAGGLIIDWVDSKRTKRDEKV